METFIVDIASIQRKLIILNLPNFGSKQRTENSSRESNVENLESWELEAYRNEIFRLLS